MGSGLWRGKLILITLFSLFFLIFGIENLIGAFALKNPLEFIVYFFSASLMVLISIVGLVYVFFQFRTSLSTEKSPSDEK